MTSLAIIGQADRIRMERAHVHAWPALSTANINGWLWRLSGGGSQRANSVSTVDFTASDAVAAIAEVESQYRSVGHPTRFQTFDDTAPSDLPQLLRSRGYNETETTKTMFKRPALQDVAAGVEARDDLWDEWLQVYLGEITESRRAVNARILASIPSPKRFFAFRRGNELVSTALCVIGFGCAVVECVTTAAGHRRKGAARIVLGTLDHWAATHGANLIGLQVVQTNLPAIRLYESLGYVAGATNRFWMRTDL